MSRSGQHRRGICLERFGSAQQRRSTLLPQEARNRWLHAPALLDVALAVVPGFPDRPEPKKATVAAILKKRTTTLYNTRGTPEGGWLYKPHRDLGAAVAAAWGWAKGTSCSANMAVGASGPQADWRLRSASEARSTGASSRGGRRRTRDLHPRHDFTEFPEHEGLTFVRREWRAGLVGRPRAKPRSDARLAKVEALSAGYKEWIPRRSEACGNDAAALNPR